MTYIQPLLITIDLNGLIYVCSECVKYLVIEWEKSIECWYKKSIWYSSKIVCDWKYLVDHCKSLCVCVFFSLIITMSGKKLAKSYRKCHVDDVFFFCQNLMTKMKFYRKQKTMTAIGHCFKNFDMIRFYFCLPIFFMNCRFGRQSKVDVNF